MKFIYKNEYGIWQEKNTNTEQDAKLIQVEDDVLSGFMNSEHYKSEDYSESEYKKATQRHKLYCAKKTLEETDYIFSQWAEENELGIPHNRTEESYIVKLQQRQDARELIRNIV